MYTLEMKQVAYTYNGIDPVLQELNFTFEAGKITCIAGKSGAGKTTLLSLLSHLTLPTEGEILYQGTSLTTIDPYYYRSHHAGVIFQSYNLLPNLTAIENVVLSMELSGKAFAHQRASALSLLEKVGLDEAEANRRILKLSGGQQQRVAIARTLSYDPQIILADEPTGNLDEETQEEIMDIFRTLADEEQKCVIIVTHSPSVVAYADEIYTLKPLQKK